MSQNIQSKSAGTGSKARLTVGIIILVLIIIAVIVYFLLSNRPHISVISPPHSVSGESNVGNAIIEANVIYVDDNGNFGNSADSLIKQIRTGETAFNYGMFTNARAAFTSVNTVYLARFYCYHNGSLAKAGGLDFNGSDDQCQGLLLMDYSSGQATCYGAAVFKAQNVLHAVNILGKGIANPGIYYTAKSNIGSCSPSIVVSSWHLNGFPPE